MIRIVMTSYMPDDARTKCAMQVVASLSRFLRAPEPVSLHISDDGSPANSLQMVHNFAKDHCKFVDVSCTVAPRRGIGGSLNRALATVDADDLWLYVTDDWTLLDTLNLTRPVALLRKHGYDYVRMGPIHPNLTCISRFYKGLEYWLELCPGQGGFCFATRPFLATKRFYTHVGSFIEQKDAYDTEQDYALRVAEKHDSLRLAYVGPLDSTRLWHHIGDVSPVGRIVP